jgi:hypothetical protein
MDYVLGDIMADQALSVTLFTGRGGTQRGAMLREAHFGQRNEDCLRLTNLLVAGRVV